MLNFTLPVACCNCDSPELLTDRLPQFKHPERGHLHSGDEVPINTVGVNRSPTAPEPRAPRRHSIQQSKSPEQQRRRLFAACGRTTSQPHGAQSLPHHSHCQHTSCPPWISHRPRPLRQVISTGLVRPHPLLPWHIRPPTPSRLLRPPSRTSSSRPRRTGTTGSTWQPRPHNSNRLWPRRWNRTVNRRV